MSEQLAFVDWEHELLEGPFDVGSEQRWRVRTSDGRTLVVAQLAQDLARDESIRRRWVRDAMRLQAMAVHSVVPTLSIGPEPDPRDPDAESPWRVRLDPPAEPLARWLERAPVTLGEFTSVFALVADALQAVHATGAVLRDLRPEQILRTSDGRILLADVGLSRVDILSSHTASSLLLQGSSYAAPEQVTTTAVDLRSDLFSLGVMMWRALTGSLPFGDGPAFLTRAIELPPLSTARADVPANIDLVVRACLARDPARRPSTAMDVAWVLRGDSATSLAEQASTTCQHCAAKLRLGQRLCLECGRVSVKFVSAAAGEPVFGLDLRSLGEDAKQLKWLQEFLRDVSKGPIRAPEFIVGSAHLYSDQEKMARIRLPVRLYGQLSQQTAQQLNGLMREQGLDTAVVSVADLAKTRRLMLGATAVGVMLALLGLALGGGVGAAVGFGVGVVLLVVAATKHTNLVAWIKRAQAPFQLRPIPAALPASDPLVSRLAALLRGELDDDARAAIAEMALLVQRLVDHRAQFVRDASEIDMVTAPLEPLVASVETRIAQLQQIAEELASLDEGAMVRALAAADARRDQNGRTPILDNLDRIRALEDQRAAVFRRLLQAQSLLTRTVEMGLAQHDDAANQDRQLALAVATLTGS